MNSLEHGKSLCRLLPGLAAVALFGYLPAHADTKKSAPAAPHVAPKAPSKPAGGGAAHTGGASTAGHSPTTAGGHTGITTSNAGHTTTSTAGHTTTSTAGHATTTGGHATTTAGHAGAATGHTAGTSGAHGAAGGAHAGAAGGRPTTAAGARPVPAGSKTVRTANGSEVRTRANGKPSDVHVANKGMDIHHGLNGNRRVEVQRADHSRIVAERGGRGYVQRPYMYHGHEYGHRTYYYHGRAYDRFYGRYPYHGMYLDVYSPAYYYRPAFYGWAYNPWVSPISYSWGWGGNPWYGAYGYYFAPYPVYASASLWLTDYMISTTLQAAYQARVDAGIAAAQASGAPPPDASGLTPQVKDLISAEVQRQVALENAEAQAPQNADTNAGSSGIQRMMTDNVQHVFVAGKDLDVVDAGGAECAISEGDALQLSGPPGPGATAATLVVLSTKGGQECHRGANVTVAVNDLQDMQNHMRETIDQGMGELQAKQGKGGLPALPPSANAPPTKAAFAADAPGPDPSAGNEIAQQSQQADVAEKEALQGAGVAAAPEPAGPPPTLSLGQTIDEITAVEGQPKSVVDLGAKKIYVYKDGMKVTFKGGKATDIQ